jgi:TP901 family phage tail tape measure protein
MADVNANIDINIDSSNALSQLKALQRQISQFHTSIAKSSEAAALAQKGLQKNLLNSINSIGAFSAEMRTVKTSAESFTHALETNKFSMREYFRYAGASTKTFGRLFKSEFDTIGKVAEERVKRLQTQYIKMGRDTNGAMKAMAIMPTQLDMSDYNTKVQLAAQKQALFNQLMKQGSTNLLNFGKNTQWAGRQLMVGFTLPLMAVGTAATKTFMDMEAQALRFRKVYGDLFTPQSETKEALANITELGKQFTKYGVAVSQTVGLAAEAAAAGFQGLDLQRQTAQATRLSILGQVESQKALETTISLQNAFGMSSDKLAESIDFLNAVENQTVVSLDDITTAIPKVAPVIQQLGGDVKDLTFFIAAMKEGGINASEGANALKSGLAALINPTKKASDMLAGFGINATSIVEKNKGNLKATVVEFANALNSLDPLARARAIEQMFGKFQFARLSTLFANVAKDGNQAARVLDLANSSVEELAALSEKELGMTAESSMNKFKKSVEDLKIALVPVGEAFLQALTPIIEFVGGILEKFANLSDGTKKLITLLTVGVGAVGPVLLMTFGLLANGVANIIKLFLTLRGGYQRLTGQTSILGEQTQYMTMEQLDAAAAAHSLNQTHATLTQTFTAERVEISRLISAYNSAAGAARNFAMNNPGMMMPGRGARKLANGIVSVPGPKGAGDVVPAMLSPGESVIPADMTKKYSGLIQGMISNNIPGYVKGRSLGTAVDVPGGMDVSHFGTKSSRTGAELLSIIEGLETAAARNVRKMVASFEDGLTRVFTTFDNQVVAQFTEINRLMQTQGKASTQKVKQNLVGAGFAETRDIELQRQLVQSGTSIDEFRIINKKITDEIITGFDALGDKTEITSEELNNLLRKAYEEVAKTDVRVEKAYNNMKQVSSVFSPDRAGVRGSRIPITEESYIKQKKSTQKTPSQYKKMQGQMVGAENIPYAQSSRFVVTNSIAKELDLSSKQAADIYNKMSADAKVTLSRMRNDLTAFKKEFIIEAAKVGEMVGTSAVNATAKAAGTASPSRKTRRVGEDIGRGLEEGMKSRQDDVALVGSQLGSAATGGVKGGVGPIPFRGPGQAGSVAASAPRPGVSLADITAKARFNRDALLAAEAQKQTEKMNARMNSLNKAFMSGTFALSALSGVASMAGGNLGKFSEVLFQITGPIFALSSILQLLTGEKILKTLKTIGLLRFGAAAIAIGAFIVATKLINNAREKERMAIEGLANAITTTKEKLETLGGFFGVTPTQRAGSSAVLSNIQAKPNERSQIQGLKKTEDFQKNFEKDIKALSQATNQEALLALQTLALDLRGQGFAKAQVDIIIKALLEEAKKSKLILEFAQLDLSKEEGRAGAIALAQDITKNFNQEFEKGVKKTRAVISTRGGTTILGPEQLKLTNDQQKQLKLSSQELSNVLAGVSGQFKAGSMKGSEYTDVILKILKPTEDIAYANLLLQKTLIAINPEYAKATAGVKDYETRLLLLRAAILGVTLAEELVLTTINGSVYEQESARAKIRKMLEQTEKDIDNQNKITAAATQTGKGELKGLAAKIKALKDQTAAFTLLVSKQVDFKTALELTNDAEIVAEILATKNLKTTKQRTDALNDYLKLIKEFKIQSKINEETVADPRDVGIARLDNLQKFIALNETLIDLRTAPQIKAFNDEIEKQEGLLQGVNDQIQKITQDQIEPIQKVIEGNNYVLQQIALQEEAINEKYNKQIEALDKIEKANQNIANIQKQRMSIADALTRGDISAAAQAVQEARAERAQSALTGQRDILTRVRDENIGTLGRIEIEKRNKVLQSEVAKIEREQLLTLQEQKTQIESNIDATNRKLKVLNTTVEKEKESATYSGKTRLEIDTTKTLLELSKGPLDAYAAQLAASATSATNLANELERALKATLAISGKTGTQSTIINPEKYDEIQSRLTAQNIAMGIEPGAAAGLAGMSSRLQAQADAYFRANPNIDPLTGLQRKMYGGAIMSKGKGGMGIVKAMAFGGRAIGSDTVPAMLTPGEFVVNKAASKAYGPLLERINESKYPGMLSSSGQPQVPVNNISTSTNDNSTAVYNYNLGFSINGANGSAKDIANAVMREIKNVDSQRIRGQRR